MQRIPFQFNKLYYGCFLALLGTPYLAYGEEVEFDERFLGIAAGQPTADLSKYRVGNPIPSGMYAVDVFVNGIRHGAVSMEVEENEKEPIKGICFTPKLQAVLSLKKSAIQQPASEEHCISVVDAVPEGQFQFDLGDFTFNLEIPQIFVQKRPRGYVSPSLWQSGDPVLFVRYNANHYVTKSGEATSKRSYLGVRAGANLGGWSVRHQGSKAWQNQRGEKYQYQDTYAQHDIDEIKGQFTFGDFYSNSDFFENFSLRGVRVVSDERMLPYSQRGYAPQIEGIANSNARVVIRQEGRMIYETTVPAGAFRIDDLYPTGYSGKLEVEIIEADGQIRRFSVPFSSAVRLVRAGQWRYKATAGRYREGTKVFKDRLFQGEVQYGVMNGLTLNLGTMVSRDYLSGLIGLAFDTPIGAFSTDFIRTQVHFPHLKKRNKQHSLNIGYNAKLNRYGSYFSARFYRSFSPESYSLRQVLEANRDGRVLFPSDRLRQKMTLSFSQNLGEGFGSLSLSSIRSQYWQMSRPIDEYQLSYGNHYKRLQFQIGYSQSRDPRRSRQDRQFYFNGSLQLGSDLHSPTLYANYYNYPDSDFVSTSLSGTLGEENQFNYNVATNWQHSQYSTERYYSANMGYKASPIAINVGAAKSGRTQQMNLNLSGAVVAHGKGVTLSNDLGDTFAIIHAKGAGGAKINNGNAAHLDWFGNGIVPHLSPYQVNYVGIDPDKMPADVEIDATGQEIIPRANSAVLVQFATKTGKSVLFDVSLPDGSVPPLAAEVFDANNQLIGYVVQGGQVFVRGIDNRGTLKVIWGASEKERCHFDYQLSENNQPLAVQCR